MAETKPNEHSSHLAKGSNISGFSTQVMFLGLFLTPFFIHTLKHVLFFYLLFCHTSAVSQPSDALGSGCPP